MNPSVRRDDAPSRPGTDGRSPLPCQHEKPGTWVRFYLIRDYAARGYCCVHGFIPDEEAEPQLRHSPPHVAASGDDSETTPGPHQHGI